MGVFGFILIFLGLLFLIAPNLIIPREVIDFRKHTVLGIVIGLVVTLIGVILGFFMPPFPPYEVWFAKDIMLGHQMRLVYRLRDTALILILVGVLYLISTSYELTYLKIIIGITPIILGIVFMLLFFKFAWGWDIIIIFMFLLPIVGYLFIKSLRRY